MSTIANRLLSPVQQAAEWVANQLSPQIPVNEGIAAALMLQTALKGKDVDDPPADPDEGDGYIVGSSPSGDFVDIGAKNIAFFHNGAWQKMTAIDQLRVYANDGSGDTEVWEFDGTDWQKILRSVVIFTDIDDTPTDYTDDAGKVAAVNATEDGIAFKATPMPVPVVFGAAPEADEVIARYTLSNTVDFAADFAGSVGSVEVNPDATFDIDVQVDGASIGTVSISSAGVYTFTTASGAAQSAAAGSKLEFVAPSTPDSNITGISFMLRATTVDL